jgi:hypothetical protein
MNGGTSWKTAPLTYFNVGGFFVAHMKTKDIDIRNILNKRIIDLHRDDPDTVIINELGLCQGMSRIDIAVINGFIHGYEIKSEKDTLERLPSQVDIYSKIFDQVTLVTSESHMKKALEITPSWWGIAVAGHKAKKKLAIDDVRPSNENPSVDPFSIAQLLWRDEAIEILRIHGLEKGLLSKSRTEIWRKLSTCVPLDQLKRYIRDRVKIRANWRSVHKPL